MAPNSKINARELANALLSEGEVRGTHASGYSYVTRDGKTGTFKAPITGSQLELKGLPRKADSVIMHTRFATHGPASENVNNHPLKSVDERITLVHNGVLFNHDSVRAMLTNGSQLPEVDSSVAPEMLSEYGTDGFSVIGGDAAFAWFDTQTGNTIHLSRLNHSPVSIARLEDGSFVFASTDGILAKALKRLGLRWFGHYPKPFIELQDGDYLTIQDAKAQQHEDLDWDRAARRYTQNWRNATSGGHGNVTTTTAVKASAMPVTHTPTQKAITPAFTPAQPVIPATVPEQGPVPPEGGWQSASEDVDKAWAEAWMSGDDSYGDDPDGWFDENNNWRTDIPGSSVDDDSQSMVMGGAIDDRFYVIDHDGDYQGQTTPQGLAAMLHWWGEMTTTGAGLVDEGEATWVNHFADVGEVLADGSMSSWLKAPEMSEDFDKDVLGGFAFVRSGLSILQNVMSA